MVYCHNYKFSFGRRVSVLSHAQKLLIVNESLSPPSSSHKRRKLDEDGERDGEREWEEELHEHTRHASSLESRYAIFTTSFVNDSILTI